MPVLCPTILFYHIVLEQEDFLLFFSPYEFISVACSFLFYGDSARSSRVAPRIRCPALSASATVNSLSPPPFVIWDIIFSPVC